MLALPGISVAQCLPKNSSQNEAEIEHLRDSLRKQPGDPVLLYNLAADYATECDQATTLAFLRQASQGSGGLDPSAYRGFAFLHDTSEFQAIVADIRRKNPLAFKAKQSL
jgi:hypothetical protein